MILALRSTFSFLFFTQLVICTSFQSYILRQVRREDGTCVIRKTFMGRMSWRFYMSHILVCQGGRDVGGKGRGVHSPGGNETKKKHGSPYTPRTLKTIVIVMSS